MNPRSLSALIVVVLAGLSCSTIVLAWSFQEHREITAAAVELLASSGLSSAVPDRDAMVRSSVQPDLMRPRQMPMLRELEAPRHFIDLELLQGAPLPESASEYVKLIARLGEQRGGSFGTDWRLETVGGLPYALVESTQRLAALFAQLREQPDDKVLGIIAMHQAGIMAHYSQDLCQPLHTTVHHDGQARDDGSSPRSGVHRQVDSLLRAVSVAPIKGRSQAYEDLFGAILEELAASHARVDSVYELIADLDALQDGKPMSPALEEFGRQRFERAVRFTANLFHTAWMLSETIELPDWAIE